MGLFGKTPQKAPKDQVNEWCSKLRKESYKLDRQITKIKQEEEKVKKSLKDAAAKNDKEICIILAKEIVRSRQATKKIYTSKATINSVQMQMKSQLATLRIAGALQKSTEVMHLMQNLVRLPEISQTMREMSMEMTKAGILEEMIDETMESMEDVEELEEEAQKEIDKVLWEVTEGKLGEAPAVPAGAMSVQPEAEAAASEELEDAEDDMKEMQKRLEELRS
ncbi:charged multivesicular body protein 3-like [Culicoides brevitarsis]|uniref:charged multivesicular body protein 3-like n=1 Tax=Culicoides brevitarsis TaxID=469753 RepID=UPI00307C920C